MEIDARAVISDLGALPKSLRRRLTPVRVAAAKILAATKRSVMDTTTPWKGPGSSPKITKAVVLHWMTADANATFKGNMVIAPAEVEANLAYEWALKHPQA